MRSSCGHLVLELEKAMAPHSSTLAWTIPWTEEPGRLLSMGSLRVRHDWATSLSLFTFMHWRRKWQPLQYSSCLENPRDRGAWWAAVYGVAQSWTRLKRLSSSSSSSPGIPALLWTSFTFLKACFSLISALQVTFQVHIYYFNEAVGSVKSIVCCSCFSFYLSPSVSWSLSYKLLFSLQSRFLAPAPLSFVGYGWRMIFTVGSEPLLRS